MHKCFEIWRWIVGSIHPLNLHVKAIYYELFPYISLEHFIFTFDNNDFIFDESHFIYNYKFNSNTNWFIVVKGHGKYWIRFNMRYGQTTNKINMI